MCVLTSAFLVYRMGLEALVESYAFWRPSLRTLTFEDIPGIAKQGSEPQEFSLLIAALASLFIRTLLLASHPHLKRLLMIFPTLLEWSNCALGRH